jgi:hypothetical protein
LSLFLSDLLAFSLLGGFCLLDWLNSFNNLFPNNPCSYSFNSLLILFLCGFFNLRLFNRLFRLFFFVNLLFDRLYDLNLLLLLLFGGRHI